MLVTGTCDLIKIICNIIFQEEICALYVCLTLTDYFYTNHIRTYINALAMLMIFLNFNYQNSNRITYKIYFVIRLETPLILTIHPPKQNSAVQQLFNSGRPPPPAIEAQLVTSETLR